ncbi:MAG: RNA-binding S4 domain-containing protein [Saprospiraceae bacterium]|nr:RNA-binding S4 domain-containing protein [Saprospiraceae bacterium]
MEKVRIDKWLWAVRFFKSRSQATDACREGKVVVADVAVKASQTVVTGDRITVKKNGIFYDLEVVKLIEKRVGAPIAQTCVIDHTPEEELHKFESWYLARSGRGEHRDKGLGRPTKRDRRDIDRLKEGLD